MKVYIVMDGCIGDIYPKNVFKTQEKAEEWIKENSKEVFEPYIEE